MIDLSEARLTTLAVHKVGNKSRAEGIVTAKELFPLDEDFTPILQDYFLLPFKSDAFYQFTHETDLKFNELYQYCRSLFEESRETFIEHSINILQHLYKQSGHPSIKSGELYVAHFRECQVDGVDLEAIGIFKSENKDLFIKVEEGEDQVSLRAEEGLPIRKLDKGCLVFNTFSDEGYSILMVDRSSENAQYWRDDFLHVERLQDNHYQTESFLSMTRDFCEEVVAQEQDLKDQVVFLNKSMNYFNQNKEFELDGFQDEVLENPTHREQFEVFRQDYEEKTGMSPSQEGFPISRYAVRNMRKQIKSLIKLDTQIEIKLNPRNVEEAGDFIERGWDDQRSMYYYKVFFNEEEE
ncbi:MAG: nucleoid-associated protein [Bacteroidota bacterium]